MSHKSYKPQPLHLSDEELAAIKKRFEENDEDGDGKLDRDEMENTMIVDLFDTSLIPLVFEICDLDKNGLITFDEFCVYIDLLSKLEKDPSIIYRNLFEKFDTDNNGYLEKDEIIKFMKLFYGDDDDEFIKNEIEKYDENKDGRLSFEELIQLLDYQEKNLLGIST